MKNLLGLKPHKKAMYLVTGLWSLQCITEAKKHIAPENLIEVATHKGSNYTQMVDPNSWNIDKDASYFHYCSNETVNGFELTDDLMPWHLIPRDVAVVADCSSNIGTRYINWNRVDVVYAGAQKNLGPTGCTIIIVNKKMLNNALPDVPIMCDWTTFENSPGTYYNTPPCFNIYVTWLNIKLMNKNGGLPYYSA